CSSESFLSVRITYATRDLSSGRFSADHPGNGNRGINGFTVKFLLYQTEYLRAALEPPIRGAQHRGAILHLEQVNVRITRVGERAVIADAAHRAARCPRVAIVSVPETERRSDHHVAARVRPIPLRVRGGYRSGIHRLVGVLNPRR